MPAKRKDGIFGFLDGVGAGVEYIKSGNNFYYLNYKVSEKNNKEANKSTGNGFLALLSFFWVACACTKYKANTAENQKSKKNNSSDSKRILKNEVNKSGKRGKSDAKRTISPGSLTDINSVDRVHTEIIL